MGQQTQKKHPDGLIAAALANMGERFGFYIMMAILTLFISAKFGFDEVTTGYIYSAFYAAIYLLSLVGGLIADKTKNYKGTIIMGIILMAVGYLMIGYPTPTPVVHKAMTLTLTCGGLFVIALGNGFFKGNLQALVGQMYDDPRYSANRDAGFQIFYMFINVGAIFAPFMAVGIRNWWLTHNGFDYNATLPQLCHEYLLNGDSMARYNELVTLAGEVSGTAVSNISEFVSTYLGVFSQGFHYAFFSAIVMVLVSLVIFVSNQSRFPDPGKKAAMAAENPTISKEEIKMSAAEVKQRIYALFAVFGVVIFFWFSFHQNGYSLTYFARDYVNLDVINIDLGFTTIKGAEIFQSINPFFVVSLTPLVMWFFAWRKNRGKEISTPMKIALGMGIAGLAYVYLAVISFALPDSSQLGSVDFHKLTPWVMVGLYLILTVAELFISPLGLSFVSKVAPPHLQGLMQGCWLAATAIGNSILFIGGILYQSLPLWACWIVFVGACALSMIVMLSMVKWLERVAK